MTLGDGAEAPIRGTGKAVTSSSNRFIAWISHRHASSRRHHPTLFSIDRGEQLFILLPHMSQHADFPQPPNRRAFLLTAAQLGVASLATVVGARVLDAQPAPKRAVASAALPPMTVYKDPNCGCCTEWVGHVRKAGFVVTVRDTADMASVKASFGVPSALESCHTARVGAYAIEGHVPADLIQKLLREQPVARGLAVPGMPMGSPGMEQGSQKDAYDVVLFDKAGKTRVYASR